MSAPASLSFAPGSFRDPSGRVFTHDGRIFRTVTTHAIEEFRAVQQSGLYDQLAAEGALAGLREVDRAKFDLPADVETVLEHDKLTFVNYPHEWPFSALKAAALLHLDIHLRALDLGVTLSDASAYNIMFEGARPVFIDHLSFRRHREGEFWLGHRQFCEQFFNPLVLYARLGLFANAWRRGAPEGLANADAAKVLRLRGWLSPALAFNVMLPALFESRAGKTSSNQTAARMAGGRKLPKTAFMHMLRRLRANIEKLSPPGGETTWSGYAANTSYSDAETEKKIETVRRFAAETRPALLWDIGCNTGRYSKLALENGAAYVVGFETDPGALERAFAMAKAENLAFTPLYMNIADPSPALGWRQSERLGLQERGPAGALIALAVIHHLCISCNIPLDQAADWLIAAAPEGLIEFVPKSDPMVQELLALREDIFADYSWEAFHACVEARARIVETIELSPGGRRIVRYSRV
ncbi:MAG: methyltransferase domain-containing protein [Rhodospirillales bacterium]